MVARFSPAQRLLVAGTATVGNAALALLIIRGLSAGTPLLLSLGLLVLPAVGLAAAALNLVRGIRTAAVAAAEVTPLAERRV